MDGMRSACELRESGFLDNILSKNVYEGVLTSFKIKATLIVS